MNVYTYTTWNNFSRLSKYKKENLEPSKEVLAIISQFAKVYYVEKPMRGLVFSIPMILN